MDLSDIFGQVEKAVNQGLNDVKEVGWPALQSSLEQSAANFLRDQAAALDVQNKQTQEVLNQNLSEVLARPAEQNSFGSFLSSTFEAAGLKHYGLYIAFGVVAIGVGGYFLLRKG